MYTKIANYIKSEFQSIRNGRVFVFLICLGLSTFLWFLNALDKHYTEHITVPVRYINVPKNKNLAGNLPKKLDLTVDAYGYTLLRHKLELVFSPVLLDVNELTNSNLESRFMSKYILSTNAHKEEIAKQISNDLEIISIRPDTISFFVSDRIEKQIKVKPNVEAGFAREYIYQRMPFSEPSAVMIKGPREVMDTLRYVVTRPLKLKNLTQSVEQKVELDLPVELSAEQSTVLVHVAVEQCTEARFEVPIRLVNRPDSLEIKTFPSKIKITCRIGLSQYNHLKDQDFKAIVDFARHDDLPSKLPVELTASPENVLSIDYFPKEVEYIIEKK